MNLLMRHLYFLFLTMAILFSCSAFAEEKINIPILCYHNFNPTVPGLMNMTPQKFEEELKWLIDNGFTVIPLKEAVEYLQGSRDSLPKKPVVITDDDGWQSVYTYMLPVVKKYNIPVTLFIYTQTISTGKHSLTWNELTELQNTGLFDIQDHTFSHPNFKQEKKHLSAASYEKFVTQELVTSKKILEDKMHKKISFIAWPYGIYDDYLEQQAKNAGYDMAFSIDARMANKSHRPMAQPRFMILQGLSMKTFMTRMNEANKKS